MPSNAHVKIRLEPKKIGSRGATWVIVALLILCILAGVNGRPYGVQARIGRANYQLKVADSKSAQSKGLGGQASMSAQSGMLFVYAGSQNLCFWMKDMHFSLDMLWLDPSRKIIKIQPNVTPNTFPHVYCATGRYVVELRAGQVPQAKLHIGQTVHF